ncbi:DUF1405 domain-containing protein [Bacillus taeanensis]|uniref:DUF1405 domain-containing protein n=1 Tax=Bacillus taeanensis TaxID=273032 RepID=A0A366Y1H6_9BACI|nr:DUF1405 domain-containing protein [Bacillus taeanensis]RBW70264.1 DUF1405 domain-containing protein [Bacillus taeanensis]
MTFISYLLKQRFVLLSLLIINILGTIYGYYWYLWQLVDTPLHFLPFVPDSPTASLFFVFVLIAFLLNRNFPLIEALAAVTLFKYGIWAVGMNLGGMYVSGVISLANIMLIASHFGMALQAILYAPFYRFTYRHLLIAAVWTIHNDIIDYVFQMYPRYPALKEYIPQIGYMTFWLSVVTLLLIYAVAVRKERYTASLVHS